MIRFINYHAGIFKRFKRLSYSDIRWDVPQTLYGPIVISLYKNKSFLLFNYQEFLRDKSDKIDLNQIIPGLTREIKDSFEINLISKFLNPDHDLEAYKSRARNYNIINFTNKKKFQDLLYNFFIHGDILYVNQDEDKIENEGIDKSKIKPVFSDSLFILLE